jgi:hypothetical protein
MPLRRRPKAYEIPRLRRAINSKGTVKVILGWVARPPSAPTRSSTPATWSLGRHWTADIDGVVVVPAACVGDVAEAARRLLDAPALEAACLKYID